MGDIIGGLFGQNKPNYEDTRVTPESTMTEAAKAMQEGLTNIGKMGHEQGMKYMGTPEDLKKSQLFYQSALNALQTGGTNPPDSRYGTGTPMANTPGTATQGAVNFTPNDFIEEVLSDPMMRNDPRVQGYTQAQMERSIMPETVQRLALKRTTGKHETDDKIPGYLKLTAKDIEDYKRQKQLAADMAKLSSAQAVK